MSLRGTLLGDSLRDFEREQRILAIGHRIATVRMTEAWRAFIISCISDGDPVDAAWRVVVGECLRYLVNARAITGQGLTIPDIAEWVSLLADRHGISDMTQRRIEQLARDIVITGFMAAGEEVRTLSMRAGHLVADHAPAIIEEREAGVYQPTLEAMDFSFRNLDYERAYDHAFRAKDIMLMRQVSSGNYEEATDQVRGLRRSVAMVRAEYQRMMDGGMGDLGASDLRDSLSELARQMESINESNDLDRIADRLYALSSAHVSIDDSALVTARASLRHLMIQVSDAKSDIRDVMALRPMAESSLEERLTRRMTVRSQNRTIDLARLVVAATEGRVGVEDLLDMLLVRSSMPRTMNHVAGWGTLLSSATEREAGPRGGGLDLTTLTEAVDELKEREDKARSSMGSALESALSEPSARDEGISVGEWVGNAPECERYEWIETGVLVAFLHALHIGNEGVEGSGWRDWVGGRFEDEELVLTGGGNETVRMDALGRENAEGWEIEFEGRRISIVER